MPFTAGSLFGKYEGSQALNNGQSAFNSSNPTNPNEEQSLDIFQILSPGGGCLLQVTAAYVVNTNVGAGSFTRGTVVGSYQMGIAQYNSLVSSPTASQICAAAFSVNFNGPQWDILQIENDLISGSIGQTGAILGGGGVVWRLLYNGSTATS